MGHKEWAIHEWPKSVTSKIQICILRTMDQKNTDQNILILAIPLEGVTSTQSNLLHIYIVEKT